MPLRRSTLSARRDGRGRRVLRTVLVVVVLAVLAVVGVGVARVLAPIPRLRVVPTASLTFTARGDRAPIAWPAHGEAAIAVDGVGLVGTVGSDRPVGIGSLAKVMTAYLLLRDHPLALGASGPLLTMSSADVQVYRADRASGQSVVPVAAGERLSEYQLLVGMLLPSGNNLATLLGTWDAGSLAAFVARMNAAAARMGLRATHYQDASGADPGTVSSAADEVRLAEAAMGDAVFRQIVAMPQATLPVAGTVYNVNALVTHDGIVGVKTGYTAAAGGCLVFAADRRAGARPVLIVGAVLGQQGTHPLSAALAASRRLLQTVAPRLETIPVVGVGARLARVPVPWGTPVAGLGTRAVTVAGWAGLAVRSRLVAARLGTTLRRGQRLAVLDITIAGHRYVDPVVSAGAVAHPGLRWRLLHG